MQKPPVTPVNGEVVSLTPVSDRLITYKYSWILTSPPCKVSIHGCAVLYDFYCETLANISVEIAACELIMDIKR